MKDPHLYVIVLVTWQEHNSRKDTIHVCSSFVTEGNALVNDSVLLRFRRTNATRPTLQAQARSLTGGKLLNVSHGEGWSGERIT